MPSIEPTTLLILKIFLFLYAFNNTFNAFIGDYNKTKMFFFLQGNALCKDCFYYAFEEEIHHTIVNADLLKRGETVAIGASGGKGADKLHL